MHPTRVFVFGNPKGGPPVMVEFPRLLVDLPLMKRLWFWEDAGGKSLGQL